MYKMDNSCTVSSSRVKYSAFMLAALLLPMTDVDNTKYSTDISNDKYQMPVIKHSFERVLPLSPRPEKLISLQDQISKFLNTPKVEEIYLVSLHKSVDDSLQFLAKFPRELPLPNAHYAEDGEIVLEWFFNNKSVVLSITGDGYYGYAILKNGKYVAGQSDGSVNNIITPELYEYLQG